MALDTSAAAVSSTLQRAHRTIDDLLPEQSQQATLRALGDANPHSWTGIRHPPLFAATARGSEADKQRAA